MKDRMISFRIPDQLRREIRRYSDKEILGISSAIRYLIKKGLKEDKKK